MTKGKENIAVIGAGVFGAWTAHHLLNAGHRVTLVDAFGPANALASSGGESRLFLDDSGNAEIYTRMAMESLPQWKALSAVSGLPIFIPAGILFFFPTEEQYLKDSIAAHHELGLPSELLSRAEMAKRFPMIDFDGIVAGIYEPGFGALMARRAVLTLVDRFVRAGGEYRLGLALPPTAAKGRLDEGEAVLGRRNPGRPLCLRAWAVDGEAVSGPARRPHRSDTSGSVLLRPARRRQALRAGGDARLGGLQRR
jgi:hypothetical protein